MSGGVRWEAGAGSKQLWRSGACPDRSRTAPHHVLQVKKLLLDELTRVGKEGKLKARRWAGAGAGAWQAGSLRFMASSSQKARVSLELQGGERCAHA